MRFLLVVLIVCLPACWGQGGGKLEVYEETVLAYRQPDVLDYPKPERQGPKMMHVIRGDDGSVHRTFPDVTKLPTTPEHPERRELEWGKEYTLRIHFIRNPTWGTTDRYVNGLVKETEVGGTVFRLHSMSAPFFGDDKRSFVDGKAIVCETDKVCALLDEALKKPDAFDLLMRFGKSSSEALVVTDLVEATTFPEVH
jgi:hypothetical protein